MNKTVLEPSHWQFPKVIPSLPVRAFSSVKENDHLPYHIGYIVQLYEDLR